MTQPTSGDGGDRSIGRSFSVALACLIGLSIVGFAVGTRPAGGPELLPSVRVAQASAAMADDTHAIPAPTYLGWRMRLHGPNAELTSDLGQLRADLPRPTDPVTRTKQALDHALAARADRRAYDGAPPVIPHPIDQQSSEMCLACHSQGIRIKGLTAPAMSHALLINCTQCHVPSASAGQPAVQPANTFVGLASAGPGTRAWRGAPPTIPHGRWMRQRCASCHGVSGRSGLRTTHPQRQSCPQCHVLTGAEPE